MTRDEALRLALEALKTWAAMQPNTTACAIRIPAIAAIQKVLAQEEWTPEDTAHRPGGLSLTDWEAVAADQAMTIAMMKLEQEPWLLESTQTLAKNLAREFYPEVTQWECLDGLAGVISQIDNMTTGLMRKPKQEPVAVTGGGKTYQDLEFLPNAPQLENGTLLYTSPPQRQPLVSIEMLLDWKSQVNEIAARTNKVERHTAGAALKQSIADVISAHGIGDKT